MDEAYIKYKSNWVKCEIEMDAGLLYEFNLIRTKLIKMGMIGKIPDGPGFGNISIRTKNNAFYISATDTGHLNTLESEHISLVTKTSIVENTVWCTGLLQASSESMSHASIYDRYAWVKAIIHVHHKPLWKHYLNKLPTTNSKITYGTVAMAEEINSLLNANPQSKVLILGGHEDGIFAFGETIQDAYTEIENLFQRIS